VIRGTPKALCSGVEGRNITTSMSRPSRIRTAKCLVRPLVALSAAAVLVVPTHVLAQPVVTASDPDDVGSRLDLRAVSLSPAAGDRSRITIVFWNRVPSRLLTHHVVRAELSWSEDRPTQGNYYFRITRTKSGRLQIVWGEGGSSCCSESRADHPDPFTYTGRIQDSVYGFMPSPRWLRGISSGKVDCRRRLATCTVSNEELVDRTQWTRF
jgi:hypothetical protein